MFCNVVQSVRTFTESVYEVGAENRVLDDVRFNASTNNAIAHYGRLNMPMAWQPLLPVTQSQWFKVDLGRVLLVNAISIQGDPRRGESFYSDYKIQYNLNDIAVAGSLVTIKEEDTSSERV